MPPGLLNLLGKGEILDLLAWLERGPKTAEELKTEAK